MTHGIDDLASLSRKTLSELTTRELADVVRQLSEISKQHRQENALLYYEPVSKRAMRIHESDAKLIGVGGGNRSGKSETVIAELAACATGIVPHSLRHLDWSKKLVGPIAVRIVVANLEKALHETILPKLVYSHWTGQPGKQGKKGCGHWGWIPRDCLIDGDWDKSWKEKLATLTVLYRDPENRDRVLGESKIQFNSHTQSPASHASGDIHIVMLDEPSTLSIYRENQARVMSSNGRIFLSMTWPDDPAINVDWIYDEVYEPGQPGPSKHPEVEWIELHSLENKTISQEGLKSQMSRFGAEEIERRYFGRQMRFSSRIHPLFTDSEAYFCFECGDVRARDDDGACFKCSTQHGVTMCHVENVQHERSWPVLFALDPHPRKPHVGIWVAVTPQDHLKQVAEIQCAGDPIEMARMCARIEGQRGFHVVERMMDPRMGGSPCGPSRTNTWQDEFDRAGLYCDLADPSDVGRDRVNTYLRPSMDTGLPQMSIDADCELSIHQMSRFRWDDWRMDSGRDPKQRPKEKDDDVPACWRYIANRDPSYAQLVARRGVIYAAPDHRPKPGKTSRFPGAVTKRRRTTFVPRRRT